MDEILSYAQTTLAHLDLRKDILSRSLTNANVFWDYMDLLEPDYTTLLSDTFALVGVFMVSGINAFRDLDPKSKNASSNFISELVAKYTISDKSESFAVGILNLVSRHPIAVAYHLKWDYKLQEFGTLNGLPHCLAFPGGWKLIPESEEWLPLRVLWHMWSYSLRDVRIPRNTAEYIYQEYFVADRFDPISAMSFLDVEAPNPYQVMLTLERLIKESNSLDSFEEVENVLMCINEMYPQCHRCITYFYSTYRERKTFPTATYLHNIDVQLKVSELSRGSDMFRNTLWKRGIMSMSRGFSMEAIFDVKEESYVSLSEEQNRNLSHRRSRNRSMITHKLPKLQKDADVQIPTTQGLSDERTLILAETSRFPNYGSFSGQTEYGEKGQAYQTKSKIPENLSIPHHWRGRPRTKSCDTQFTNLKISPENLNILQTSSAKDAHSWALAWPVGQISTPEIKEPRTESGEVDSTKLQMTSRSQEKYRVVRGHRRGIGAKTKFSSSQNLPELITRPHASDIFQTQTMKDLHTSLPAALPVTQTLPPLGEDVLIKTSEARESEKKRGGKKGLTQFLSKSKTSEEPSTSLGRAIVRGLRTKSNIPQIVSSSHLSPQVMLPSLDNPAKNPEKFGDKEYEDSSHSESQ